MAAEVTRARSSEPQPDRLPPPRPSYVTRTDGRHPLIPAQVACPAGQDLVCPSNLHSCCHPCRSFPRPPTRPWREPMGTRDAKGRRRLPRKFLVHHEDGVESTVGVRLDSDVEGIALPPVIDDVAIPVTSGRQCDDLLPRSTDGFHLASFQVPVVEVAHHLALRGMGSVDGEHDFL